MVKVKVYKYTGLDRPLGHQEVEVSRISRQSAHESRKVEAYATAAFNPQETYLVKGVKVVSQTAQHTIHTTS